MLKESEAGCEIEDQTGPGPFIYTNKAVNLNSFNFPTI